MERRRVSLVGWQLQDQDGNAFTFPALTMFQGGAVTIYTREGISTVVELYWGLDDPIWESGGAGLLTRSGWRGTGDLSGPMIPMANFDRYIETIIQNAIKRDEFDNLPGKGKPLNLNENQFVDQVWRMAYSLLEQHGYALPWMEDRK